MLLADIGADVIKVEPPKGDFTRYGGPFTKGDTEHHYGGYFASVNRSKRSIVLDLQQEADRDTLRELVRDRRRDRRELPRRRARQARPRLRGAGGDQPAARVRRGPRLRRPAHRRQSPYADWPAFDVVAQAMSGLTATTGEPGTFGTRIGPSVGDIYPATLLALGIVSAVHEARRVRARSVRRRGDVRRARRDVRGDGVPLEPLGSPRRAPRQRASDPSAVRIVRHGRRCGGARRADQSLADPVRGDGAARSDRRRAHLRQPRPQQEPGDGARDHRGLARRADDGAGARRARRPGAGRSGEQQRDAVRRPPPSGARDARGVPDAGERAADRLRQHADQVQPDEGRRQPAGAAARRARRRGAGRSRPRRTDSYASAERED